MTKPTIETRLNQDSQHLQIINHFMTKGSLTVLTAIQYIGCYALSQRVGELRKLGFEIKDKWVTLDNGKKIKEYSMDVKPR
jgi:hypothetical protein